MALLWLQNPLFEPLFLKVLQKMFMLFSFFSVQRHSLYSITHWCFEEVLDFSQCMPAQLQVVLGGGAFSV